MNPHVIWVGEAMRPDLTVPCPTCNVAMGQDCHGDKGPHVSRVEWAHTLGFRRVEKPGPLFDALPPEKPTGMVRGLRFRKIDGGYSVTRGKVLLGRIAAPTQAEKGWRVEVSGCPRFSYPRLAIARTSVCDDLARGLA